VPIAATNALLTLVTLFIYRSWAKARSRRYLWSRTWLIDDELVWSGTGKEMFVGFIVGIVFLAIAGLAINLGLPALAIRAGPLPAVGALAALYLAGFFLYSIARYRALRYRLTRTWWHGMRGGSDKAGWAYGRKAIGYYLAAFLSLGFLYPWTQAKLWNERWRDMSFGQQQFSADMTTKATRAPFYIFWVLFIVGNGVLGLLRDPNVVVWGPGYPRLVIPLLAYAIMGIAYVNYLAAFYVAAVDNTHVGGHEFSFEAEMGDWVTFYLRTIGLTIVTLGLAVLIYDYRKWRFITSHLNIYGSIDIDALAQSRTSAPREAEGFLDALDIGAF
jgi:uncharacterized membrane protein YjgN (DUF898 family)